MTRFILVLVLRLTPDLRVDYLYSLEANPHKTSVTQQWIYANHIENTPSSVVSFTARCIATDVFVVVGMCLATRCLAMGMMRTT
jgi:hypothetical protein